MERGTPARAFMKKCVLAKLVKDSPPAHPDALVRNVGTFWDHVAKLLNVTIQQAGAAHTAEWELIKKDGPKKPFADLTVAEMTDYILDKVQ